MSDDYPRPPFTSVVLAGGHSRRFGEENKAVAVVEGSTLVQCVLEAVGDVADDAPIVAVKSDDQRTTIEAGLEPTTKPAVALDSPSFEGPLAGLYGSLPRVEREWLFLTGCDMPRLSPDAIGWLAGRLGVILTDRTGATDFTPDAATTSLDALVPVHSDGESEPLHAFYRRDAVAEVRNRIRPDAGLRRLLDELSAVATVPIPSAPADVSLSASVESVDTKCEHRRVRRRLER